MKKSKFFIVASLLTVLLVGMSACSNSSDDDTSTKNQSKPDNTSQSTDDSSQSIGSSTDSTVKSDNSGENNDNEQSSNSSDEMTKETIANAGSENSDSNVDDKEDKETLSQFSNEQIEYARVWLQLGANQEIDGLYVRHIPAGTLLNPNDDTSASYPEDVIQLAGSRLVDGSVTYSGNGDGTINVYNVPLRWDGSYPAGEKFYTDIIENTKLVYVDPGDDEKIIALIKLLKVH